MSKSPKSAKKKKEQNTPKKVGSVTDGIIVLQEKINQIDVNIDNLMREIAKNQNELEEKKAGFKSTLKRKKSELKERYKNTLEEIQSLTATQLVENESITEKIAKIADEIDKIVNSPVELPKIKTEFDFSKKTKKILKEKEVEIQKQCSEEFRPFFIKLQEEHNETIQSLYIEHENELKEIQEDAFEQLRRFKPRVFISQEELETTKRYEKEKADENAQYESQKEILLKQIKAINDEKDKELQKIFDKTKETLLEEKKTISARIKKAKASVKDKRAQIPQIKVEYTTSPEQEAKLRETAEQRLKKEFEDKLKEQVEKVQEHREKMESDIREYIDKTIKEEKEKNELEIYNEDNEVADLMETISNLTNEFKSLQEKYDQQNDERQQNEENLSQERGEKLYYTDKLNDIERKLAKYQIVEEEEEDSPEFIAIQKELDKLSRDIAISKNFYHKTMKKIEAKHLVAKTQIEERFHALEAAKDQQIQDLKRQIKETNAQIKSMSIEINKLIDQCSD